MRFKHDSVRSATVANTMVQILGVLGQLAFVPIYLNVWGGELYGAWLIVVGFSLYASLFDLGVSQASANEVIISISQSNITEARAWYLFAVKISLCMSLLALVVAFFGYPLLNDVVGNLFGGEVNSRLLCLFLILHALFLVWFGLNYSMLKSVGGNATSSWIATFVLFFEIVVPPVLALSGLGPEYAILGMVIPRGLGTIVCYFSFCYLKPWGNSEDVRQVSVPYKKIISASIGNLFIPGGMALYLQGILFQIGLNVGTLQAASFSTARTISRFPFQMGYVYTRALLPQLTRDISAGNSNNIRNMLGKLSFVFLFITVPGAVIYCFLGGWIQMVWTDGRLFVSKEVIFLLGVSVGLHAYWNMCLALLTAVNKHAGFSYVFIILISCSLFFMSFMSSLLNILLLVVLMEALLLVFVLYFLKKNKIPLPLFNVRPQYKRD